MKRRLMLDWFVICLRCCNRCARLYRTFRHFVVLSFSGFWLYSSISFS